MSAVRSWFAERVATESDCSLEAIFAYVAASSCRAFSSSAANAPFASSCFA